MSTQDDIRDSSPQKKTGSVLSTLLLVSSCLPRPPAALSLKPRAAVGGAFLFVPPDFFFSRRTSLSSWFQTLRLPLVITPSMGSLYHLSLHVNEAPLTHNFRLALYSAFVFWYIEMLLFFFEFSYIFLKNYLFTIYL